MMIFKNGTVKDDLQYKDLCKEEHEVRIAYNNDKGYFEIDNITNTMIEYPHWMIMVGDFGTRSDEYEILKASFQSFYLVPIQKTINWDLFPIRNIY